MAEAKGKRNRWGRFLLIWAAALLLLGLLGCIILYRYLDAYEQSRPEPVMDELMTRYSAEDWLNAAEENLDFTLTPFEDPAALFRQWREALSLDGTLSYRQVQKDSDRDKAVFIVRCGPVNLCTVELIPGDVRLGFGLHDWKLGRISSCDLTEGLRSVEVEITALSSQALLLNGVPLEEAYIAERGQPIQDLSPLEARYAVPPQQLTYRVGPLFGSISVTDAAGQTYAPDSSSTETLLHYDTVPAQRVRLTITAPEDVQVMAGGVPLERSDAERIDLGLLSGLEGKLGDAGYRTYVYALDGLLTLPEVRAYGPDGSELTPVAAENGRYVFLYPGDPEAEEALRPVAETFFRRYMDYLSSSYNPNLHRALLHLTLPDTELYDYFLHSEDTMYWAIRTSTDFKDLQFDHFYLVGEDCFLCTIHYEADVSGNTWDDTYSHEDQNTYELVFVRQDGVWLAAAMSVLEG